MAIDRTLGNIFKGDKVIWMIFFFLCMISIVEVFSASSSLTYKGGSYWAPIIKHGAILAVSIFFMVVVLNIKCKYFKIVTPFLLLLSFIMLICVHFVGQSINGGARWMSVLGIQFQPSEIAKGALVLATAQILSAMQTDKGADHKACNYILVTFGFIVAPIFTENLSTAALIFAVIFLMMFIGRVPWSQLGKILGGITLIGVFAFSFVMVAGNDDRQLADANGVKVESTQSSMSQPEKKGVADKVLHRASTWKTRILKFFDNTEVPPEKFDLDKDAQVGHANIAIASSNVVGKGPGNSVERDFLSQAFSDFIYAIVIEEMGIVGAVVVAMLYIFLLFRTGIIANRCENVFPALLAMGLAILLVVQALFNMLVAVGLAPVTGQPLPLISKGGTSTIINCIYVGVILSVSRSAKKRALPLNNNQQEELAVA